MEIKPWPTLGSRKLGDFRVFSVRGDMKVSPRTGKQHEFYVIEAVNWVNVIPITTDGKIVMVEQYRHGSASVELEVPGGVMDFTDSDARTKRPARKRSDPPRTKDLIFSGQL